MMRWKVSAFLGSVWGIIPWWDLIQRPVYSVLIVNSSALAQGDVVPRLHIASIDIRQCKGVRVGKDLALFYIFTNVRKDKQILLVWIDSALSSRCTPGDPEPSGVRGEPRAAGHCSPLLCAGSRTVTCDGTKQTGTHTCMYNHNLIVRNLSRVSSHTCVYCLFLKLLIIAWQSLTID